MSLIKYIISALKPKILCDSYALSLFLSIIHNKDYEISNDKTQTYDIIVDERFDKEKYDNNLNYDGFYFFVGEENPITQHKINYEFIQYAGFNIVRKGVYEKDSIFTSLPFWALKIEVRTPIILRNFGTSFNITPHVQPFEIINHPTIIYDLCKEFSVKRYLELGVRSCPVPNMIKSIVPSIIGVDTNDTPNFPGKFYKGTTDQFFASLKFDAESFFDMVFIDACHDYEYVKRDFINSLKYTKIGGFVLLHDTYPSTEYMTDQRLCSDAYRIVDYIRKCGLQMMNIPISPGLCIVKV
jgi:hypothetical protein